MAVSYLLQEDGVSKLILESGGGFILLEDTAVVVTPKPSGGGKRRSRAATYYDRPKRIILPNGEHVTVATREEYISLMDDLIAGLVPEAVEEHPAPSAKQIKKARKKTAQAALRLDVPESVIEERVAEQLARTRAEAERRSVGYPVTRVTLRTKRLAPDPFDEMRFEMIAQYLREAFQVEEDEEEEFIMNMVVELF